jgi:arylformamidase
MPVRYLDISVPIGPDMLVWSTHESPAMETNESAYAGGRTRVTTLRLTTHTGTHVDAPYHFLEDGRTVDQLPLDDLLGPAAVYDLRGQTAITADMLATAGVGSLPRVLLRTDNSRWVRTGPLPAIPAHLTEDAARYLVEQGTRLVGVDGLAVDGPDTAVAHAALLRAGVIILETLDLSEIEPGDYDLICLPLNLVELDGSPARAVLRSG